MQNQHPLRVLIVDDHVDSVDSLADVLGLMGWMVDKAYSGTQALALAANALPDVVILDINMPTMDGFETARRLQEMASRPLRIVAYSGSALSPVSRVTGSDHIECIVSKGAPFEVLIGNVRGALPAAT